jgi:3-hydroxyisobutyrate dehydrogenase-like beta-hydroxyacid dehydrogenase
VTPTAIGFIGFGEAGSTIAAGLRSAGVASIFAYDIKTHAAEAGPRIQQRARESQTTLVDSNEALARACEVLFSTVTSGSAVDAATQTAPYLEARHFYADLNSVSPALKQTIAGVVAASPARFVEAAVMAPVAPYGHQVPMLLGGPAASAFAEIMRAFGMRLNVLAGPVGSAAAVKMCRSIVVKGLEALLVECVLGASRYQADALVFASLDESFPGIDWQKLAVYMAGRVIVHGERRAREMEEVAETLRAMGIDPIMAEATARRQDSIARLNLRERVGDGPLRYEDLVESLTSS